MYQYQQEPTSSTSTGLTNKDIACGRGRRLEQHPGNVTFRGFIQEVSKEYSHKNTSRSRKALISKYIRIRVEDEDMRFVKKDGANDVWRELSLHEIKLKIGHALRDCKQPRTLTTISSKAKQYIAAIHQHTSNISEPSSPAIKEEPRMVVCRSHSDAVTMSTPQSTLFAPDHAGECDEYYTVISMDSRDKCATSSEMMATAVLSPEQDETMDDFRMIIQSGMSSSDFSSYIMAGVDDEEEPLLPAVIIPTGHGEDASSSDIFPEHQEAPEYTSDLVDLLVDMCDADDLSFELDADDY